LRFWDLLRLFFLLLNANNFQVFQPYKRPVLLFVIDIEKVKK